jgi:hypothetical protein
MPKQRRRLAVLLSPVDLDPYPEPARDRGHELGHPGRARQGEASGRHDATTIGVADHVRGEQFLQHGRDSGLGAPDDIRSLQLALTDHDQQLLELRRQLEDRDDELAAARAANRELITQLNTRS